MTHELQEGVDYLTNLYDIAGVTRDTPPDAIAAHTDLRLLDYYPSHHGRHPDVSLERGVTMAGLLHTAKIILSDEKKRQEYDAILDEWTGPVSTDGRAVASMSHLMQLSFASKTPAEVEAHFAAAAADAAALMRYTPDSVTEIEELIASGVEVTDALRQDYEIVLLQQDRLLAMDEARRGELLGLADIGGRRFVATQDYAEVVAAEISAARTEQLAQARLRATGGVAGRLALLAGDRIDVHSAVLPDAGEEPALPDYYDEQAQALVVITAKRQIITAKRLDNFRPSYPQADLQTVFQPRLAVGIDGSWFNVSIDTTTTPGTHYVTVDGAPEALMPYLSRGQVKTAIEQRFNVITCTTMEHISDEELLDAAITRHLANHGFNG